MQTERRSRRDSFMGCVILPCRGMSSIKAGPSLTCFLLSLLLSIHLFSTYISVSTLTYIYQTHLRNGPREALQHPIQLPLCPSIQLQSQEMGAQRASIPLSNA